MNKDMKVSLNELDYLIRQNVKLEYWEISNEFNCDYKRCNLVLLTLVEDMGI